MEGTVFEVECSGDWMPVEELREGALKLVSEGNDVTLNLKNLDHLDASALQILLALEIEQKRRGRQMHLLYASSHLRRWFDLAGAGEQFSAIAQENHE